MKQSGSGKTSRKDRSKGELTARRHKLTSSDPDFAAYPHHRFSSVPPRLPKLAMRVNPQLTPLRDVTSRIWNASYLSHTSARFVVENAVAPFIRPIISTKAYVNTSHRLAHDDVLHSAMYGLSQSERGDPVAFTKLGQIVPGVPPIGLLASAPRDQAPPSSMQVPPIKRLIVDSAKLARLDELLRELKDGGHRVLLYFQMTKMMNLVEEYLIFRQYKYLRLDGSSTIADRRDMVTSWQTKWVFPPFPLKASFWNASQQR